MDDFFGITPEERKKKFDELRKYISENSNGNYANMYIVWYLSHSGIFNSLKTGREARLFAVYDLEGEGYQLNGIVRRIDVLSTNDITETPDQYFIQLELNEKEQERLKLQGSKVCVMVWYLLNWKNNCFCMESVCCFKWTLFIYIKAWMSL